MFEDRGQDWLDWDGDLSQLTGPASSCRSRHENSSRGCFQIDALQMWKAFLNVHLNALNRPVSPSGRLLALEHHAPKLFLLKLGTQSRCRVAPNSRQATPQNARHTRQFAAHTIVGEAFGFAYRVAILCSLVAVPCYRAAPTKPPTAASAAALDARSGSKLGPLHLPSGDPPLPSGITTIRCSCF
jgi:hypothetical protein